MDTATTAAPRWWRGNLHTHTFWSDGRAFPEEAIAWYRDDGYHFLALCDHGEPHEGMLMPGNAWTLVRAASLTADSLIDAMERGDFVAWTQPYRR